MALRRAVAILRGVEDSPGTLKGEGKCPVTS